jgi:hypothetical protein
MVAKKSVCNERNLEKKIKEHLPYTNTRKECST